jgi:predicted nucleic acid-binding protein
MLLLDVNVLVYAHREDVPDHERYLKWLEELINGPATRGSGGATLSGERERRPRDQIVTPSAVSWMSWSTTAWWLPVRS